MSHEHFAGFGLSSSPKLSNILLIPSRGRTVRKEKFVKLAVMMNTIFFKGCFEHGSETSGFRERWKLLEAPQQIPYFYLLN